MSLERKREAPPKYAQKDTSVANTVLRPDHTQARANADKRQGASSGILAGTAGGVLAAKPTGGSVNAVTTYTPSPTAIRANAMVRNKNNGAKDAVDYLDRSASQGYLTTEQKNSIISDLHLVTPNDVAKPTASLTPSQQEFYKRAAGDGRYDVKVNNTMLSEKANAYRDIEVPKLVAPQVESSYRGISFEDLVGKNSQQMVALEYAMRGRGLSKSELDSVWKNLKTWENTRNKILRGEVKGETPSYKGISYDELAGKGGKEWIAFLYGSRKKSLTKEELEKVAAEVAQWENVKQNKTAYTFDNFNQTFRLPSLAGENANSAKDTAGTLPFSPDIDLKSLSPAQIQAGTVKMQATSLLKEIEQVYGEGQWQSDKTNKNYISRLETLSKRLKEMAVELNRDRKTIATAADLQYLSGKVDNKLAQVRILAVVHARYADQEQFSHAVQEIKEQNRKDAMTPKEVEEQLTTLKTQKQTREVKAKVKEYTYLLNDKLNRALIERYTFQMKNSANAEGVVQKAMETLIHVYDGKAFLASEHPQAAMVAYRYKFDGGIGSKATQWGLLESEKQYQMRMEIPLMTKEEAKVYLYVYGLYGFDKANAYYQSLELGKRLSESMGDVAKDNVDKYGVKNSSAYSILQKLTHSPMALATDIVDAVSGKEIDPYNYHNTNLALGEAERQAASKEMGERYGALGATTYDITMGVIDHAVLLPITKFVGMEAAVMILGMNTAASSVMDAKKRGATDKGALGYGLLCGGADMVFEIIPMSKIFGVKDTRAITPKIKQVLTNKGLMVAENFTTELAKFILDCGYVGDQTKYQLRVKELMGQGYSEEEANTKASGELFTEYLKATAETVIVNRLFKESR